MKIYGIKNCDKVRKFLKELDNKKLSYEFIDYKKTPPTSSLLQTWKKDLGELPVNKRGTTFRKIKDHYENADSRQKIQLLIENPSAIKRPMVEKNGIIELPLEK